MKKLTGKNYTCLAVSILIYTLSFGQSYNPVGPSTNLCPGQIYRYTSPVALDGGRCDRFGWLADNGDIDSNGLNSNGTVWVDVKWKNITSGRIGNFCGNIPVTINAIAQPTMSGPSTVLLCGTSSITLQAAVSSTANITGYVWSIAGTGVSPTGLVNTTAPQITINYTNWTAGSTLSATVAVGTRKSCGFTTATSPLTATSIPGLPTIPAIPRSAWVQLSPGNIDNLLAPLSFSSTLICSTSTMSVSNQPANTSLVWSSGNTSALTINPTTGAATRVNNFSGSVPLSATVANACGSNTQTKNIWLGQPRSATDILMGSGTIAIGSTLDFGVVEPNNGAAGPVTYDWDISGGYFTYGQPTSQGTYVTVTDQYLGLYVAIRNVCGPSGQIGRSWSTENGGCPPGEMCMASVFPNPSTNEITVAYNKAGTEVKLVNSNGEIVYSTVALKGVGEIKISVKELKNGTYYLLLRTNGEIEQRQIMVNH
jgi:Secretion system C-terminal sorting domain